MSGHKLFVANAQYEGFSNTPAFAPRAPAVAEMIVEAGSDCASLGEMGYRQAAMLADELADLGQTDWEWDRAQGKGRNVTGEGLNCVWRRTSAWSQPKGRLYDWTLNSFGQWPRTLLLVRLEEADDPTAFVWLGTFHWATPGGNLGPTGANTAKLAQVKQSIKLLGDRRFLIGGDFPRTDSADDTVVLLRAGLKLHGRVASTPMCAISQGAVRVTTPTVVPHGRAFDHHALIVPFSVPSTKVSNA